MLSDMVRHQSIGMKEFFIVWHDVICRCRLFIAVTCFDVSASISSCSFRRWTPLISINSHQHSLESCYYLLLRDGFQRQQNDRNIKGRSPRSSMEPVAVGEWFFCSTAATMILNDKMKHFVTTIDAAAKRTRPNVLSV